jgi:hypothetical protein
MVCTHVGKQAENLLKVAEEIYGLRRWWSLEKFFPRYSQKAARENLDYLTPPTAVAGLSTVPQHSSPQQAL